MSMTLERPETTPTKALPALHFLWLDITRQCQAACTHCYNQSGPRGEQGEMTRTDWFRVLDQAAELGARQVQFIGGEPTLNRDLPNLINYAITNGLHVEVFSNLVLVPRSLWPVLRQRRVTLATSWYSDQAAEHEAITKLRGSYAKTKRNIATALGWDIPLRAGIIDVREGQRVTEAEAQLREMGVTRISVDRVRGIGRAADHCAPQLTELCGRCADGRAAVLPNGDVAGCVLSGEMLTAGNVRLSPLATIVASPEWAALTAAIPRPRNGGVGCEPDWQPEVCTPDLCTPDADGCAPHVPAARVGTEPRGACVPDTCTPNEDSCQPSPGIALLAPPARACAPVDSCTPDEKDNCSPSASAAPRRTAFRTVTSCNPDNDSSDCSPAETEACEPSY